MNSFIQPIWAEVLGWTHQYGYHAVIPSLLLDPAGVPWGWIALMLIAEKARLNIPLILIYGFAVLLVNDIILYALGYWGGRPLMNWLGERFPKFAGMLKKTEQASDGRGILAVTFGRFLPFVGRWVGVGAGLANIPFARFVIFDILGVAITVFGFGLLAHFTGRLLLEQSWFPSAVICVFAAGIIGSVVAFVWNMNVARRRNFPLVKRD
ncbi:MAG: VTT domain-containing protein [Abditibacteriaceae bacterium]